VEVREVPRETLQVGQVQAGTQVPPGGQQRAKLRGLLLLCQVVVKFLFTLAKIVTVTI
jgi:hypothetical protein